MQLQMNILLPECECFEIGAFLDDNVQILSPDKYKAWAGEIKSCMPQGLRQGELT